MEDFKHINFDISKRKVNDWKRRINSDTIHMGLKAKLPDVKNDFVPSEISSLCSGDDILKL